MVNRHALCKEESESIDHTLLHCDKVRILWQLVFSIFGIQWVIPQSIRETLPQCHNSFIGRRCVKVWRLLLYLYFGPSRRKEIEDVLKMSCQIQDQKTSILTIFLCLVKVHIGGGYLPLVDFIDWLGLC